MTILEFECHDYERLALRNIKTVSMKPKSKLQTILGTNGAGKTALMKELSPLLSKHSEYGSDGYKRIVVSEKDDIYECMCDFRGPKNNYSIIKNGETLFSGHSSTVYQNLIQQELRLTQEIHDIRIGVTRFTTMPVAARRSFLTKLCPEDFTYAVGYYKRLTEATRDISGSIKRLYDRIMKEKAKLIDADEEARIREEIKGFIENKNDMLRHWRPMEESVEQSLAKVSDVDRELIKIIDEFDKTLKVFCNAQGYSSQQDIWNDIADAQGKLTFAESKINELCEQIESNRELLDKARLTIDGDLETLRKEIAVVARSVTSVRLSMTSDDWLEDPERSLSDYDGCFGEIKVLIDELVSDPELRYTPESHRVKGIQLTQAIEEGNRLTTAINEVTRDLDILNHRREQNHTKCPKCSHVWSRGYSEDEEHSIKAKLEKLTTAKEINQANIDELSSFIEACGRQNHLLHHLSIIASANTSLMPLWKTLNSSSLLRKDPKSAETKLAETRQQIEFAIELNGYKKRLEELELKKEVAAQTSGVDCAALTESNIALEEKLRHFLGEQRFYSSRITNLKAAQAAMEYQDRAIPTIETLLMKRSDLINKAEIANHHTAVNAIMMSLDADISTRERMLSQIDAQHNLIKALEDEVETLKSKEKLMKDAVKALSPSEGLIAQGLTGFINHFIAQMNAIIEKVWLYPLAIKPVKTSEDKIELDYNFAFTVDNRGGGLDVSEGSGAQREIFDLAFMLVAMVHLGLDAGEVFLDEFSIKMDYAHRKEAMKMVMDLVSSSNFSQIFMITHYESNYGTLTDADITVLCSENIQIPSDLKYNINSKVIR